MALSFGIDVNSVNASGNTALHYAVKYGHKSLQQYLMDKGASTSVRNNDGKLPFQHP